MVCWETCTFSPFFERRNRHTPYILLPNLVEEYRALFLAVVGGCSNKNVMECLTQSDVPILGNDEHDKNI